MGQKIHPQGYRTGFTRKWEGSWYAVGLEWKKLFFYQKELEQFFLFLFQKYTYTKISRRTRVLLFDIKLFKYILSKFFIFVLFYRFRTHRRKDVRPILSSRKLKAGRFNKRNKWRKQAKPTVARQKNKLFFWKKKLSFPIATH